METEVLASDAHFATLLQHLIVFGANSGHAESQAVCWIRLFTRRMPFLSPNQQRQITEE